MISIFIHNILPHPDNPRKDLGDLSELAASIKQNGILQNLTVVRRGEEKDFLFTCVIGHRRLAAAKLAGLETVPCTVANLTDREQLATMLMENMQRADLTLLEQAGGFQMMMNLGETLQTLAEKTGLSETTVRHRLKLNELDREKLEHRLTFGATLMDLIKLEQIEDQAVRNKVLESAGTLSFNYELRQAMDLQTAKKNKPRWIAKMDSFAKKLSKEESKAKDWQQHGYFNYHSEPDKFVIPENAGTVTYGYFADAGTIVFYKYQEQSSENKEKDAEKAALEERIRQTKEALEESSRRAFSLRLDFIRSHTLRQKDIQPVIHYLLSLLVDRKIRTGYSVPNEDTMSALFDIPASLGWSEAKNQRDAAFPPLLRNDPDKALLYMAYAAAGDSEKNQYFSENWNKKFPYYVENKALDALYDFLELLGYPISDVEALLMSGKHPAFQPGKEEAAAVNDDNDDDEDDEDEEETEETWIEEDEADE